MGIFKQPKTPLYRGLARIFVVIAVVWTGLILYSIRDEYFNTTRPDPKMVIRVNDWYSEIAMLSSSDSRQFSDFLAERRSLIQKAANTGIYSINGREQKLTDAELKAYKAILEDGLSWQVKETLIRARKEIDKMRELSHMKPGDYGLYWMPRTSDWDFRGVDSLDLDLICLCVETLISHLDTTQVNYYVPETGLVVSGTPTGLVTESDLSLLDDLRNAQKTRWMLKPLFWITAWIVPLLGLALATAIMVELFKWIARGFRPAAN